MPANQPAKFSWSETQEAIQQLFSKLLQPNAQAFKRAYLGCLKTILQRNEIEVSLSKDIEGLLNKQSLDDGEAKRLVNLIHQDNHPIEAALLPNRGDGCLRDSLFEIFMGHTPSKLVKLKARSRDRLLAMMAGFAYQEGMSMPVLSVSEAKDHGQSTRVAVKLYHLKVRALKWFWALSQFSRGAFSVADNFKAARVLLASMFLAAFSINHMQGAQLHGLSVLNILSYAGFCLAPPMLGWLVTHRDENHGDRHHDTNVNTVLDQLGSGPQSLMRNQHFRLQICLQGLAILMTCMLESTSGVQSHISSGISYVILSPLTWFALFVYNVMQSPDPSQKFPVWPLVCLLASVVTGELQNMSVVERSLTPGIAHVISSPVSWSMLFTLLCPRILKRRRPTSDAGIMAASEAQNLYMLQFFCMQMILTSVFTTFGLERNHLTATICFDLAMFVPVAFFAWRQMIRSCPGIRHLITFNVFRHFSLLGPIMDYKQDTEKMRALFVGATEHAGDIKCELPSIKKDRRRDDKSSFNLIAQIKSVENMIPQKAVLAKELFRKIRGLTQGPKALVDQLIDVIVQTSCLLKNTDFSGVVSEQKGLMYSKSVKHAASLIARWLIGYEGHPISQPKICEDGSFDTTPYEDTLLGPLLKRMKKMPSLKFGGPFLFDVFVQIHSLTDEKLDRADKMHDKIGNHPRQQRLLEHMSFLRANGMTFSAFKVWCEAYQTDAPETLWNLIDYYAEHVVVHTRLYRFLHDRKVTAFNADDFGECPPETLFWPFHYCVLDKNDSDEKMAEQCHHVLNETLKILHRRNDKDNKGILDGKAMRVLKRAQQARLRDQKLPHAAELSCLVGFESPDDKTSPDGKEFEQYQRLPKFLESVLKAYVGEPRKSLENIVKEAHAKMKVHPHFELYTRSRQTWSSESEDKPTMRKIAKSQCEGRAFLKHLSEDQKGHFSVISFGDEKQGKHDAVKRQIGALVNAKISEEEARLSNPSSNAGGEDLQASLNREAKSLPHDGDTDACEAISSGSGLWHMTKGLAGFFIGLVSAAKNSVVGCCKKSYVQAQSLRVNASRATVSRNDGGSGLERKTPINPANPT